MGVRLPKSGQFSADMYSHSIEKKRELEEKIRQYEEWLSELRKELDEVNEAIEFFKPKAKTIDSIIARSGLIFYGGGEAIDIRKSDTYDRLSSWTEKVFFIIEDLGRPLTMNEIYKEIAKYERTSADDQVMRKRVRNAIWSMEKSNQRLTKVYNDSMTEVQYGITDFLK
jgi:hypothetical protein